MIDAFTNWLSKAVAIIFSIMITIISFFLNETYSNLKELDSRISIEERQNIETKTKSFTQNDWAIAKAFIESDKIITEKRLTALETTIPQIKDSLIRIEKNLERNHE